MSDPATTTEVAEPEEPAALEPGGPTEVEPPLLPGEVHAHPSPAQYVVIAVILVVITSFEVGLYYAADAMPRWVLVSLLLISALLKFALVASWFMHLRTDQPIFRRFFVLGITAAVILYVIVLSTFNVFSQ
ncbi:MAG: cytochrome C oxidase subunit IV family protein [Acidimicrobiia bacterium]